MQLEFHIPSTGDMDALDLATLWSAIEDFESDGVEEMTAAILAALEAAGEDVELSSFIVDDYSAPIPVWGREKRVEEVARLFLYLEGLEIYQDVDKGVILAYASEDWSNLDFEELQDNRHYASDMFMFEFPEGDYAELGERYVEDWFDIAHLPAILTRNIDFDGVGQDVACEYTEYSWAGTSYLLSL